MADRDVVLDDTAVVLVVVSPLVAVVPLCWTAVRLNLGDAARTTAFRTAPTRFIERLAFANDFRAAALDAVGRIYDG